MKIIGTGSALPVLAVTNDMIAEILDTSDEWISTRTGVKERRILSKETLRKLPLKQQKKQFKDANIASTDLDYIICSNLVNSLCYTIVEQHHSRRNRSHVSCLDINVACADLFCFGYFGSFFENGKS